MTRPAWIAFDLNGTLTDPRALTEDERGPGVLDDTILQSMADTLTGVHRPFTEYLRAALERALADPAQVDAAMERAARLPAFPDAAAALQTLTAAGFRVAVVTNSAAAAGRATLEAAGLEGHVELVVGADEAGAYKPDPRVYANAQRRLGAAPEELCLVAAHAWDVLGAMRAGWSGAWVGHRERRLLATVQPPPVVQAPTLLDAARALAARWPSA